MAEDIFDNFDLKTGSFIWDEKEVLMNLERKAKQIKNEFAKISKQKSLGGCMDGLYEVNIYILDDENKPQYVLYVYGKKKAEMKKVIKKAIDKFIDNRQYAFNKEYGQLRESFSGTIRCELNETLKESEFWCSEAEETVTLMDAHKVYTIYVIKFDRSKLNNEISFDGNRHPYIEGVRNQWEWNYNSIEKKICYNELFRRASKGVLFLYQYQEDFNALSAMKYENEINKGSLISLEMYRDDVFEEKAKNYDIKLKLSVPIGLVGENYKKLRKLLEITKGESELSLLMNDQAEVFAIGKMKEQPGCNYYKVRFINFLEWKFYINDKEYLTYSNMLPLFPEKTQGIRNEDIELLLDTFGESNLENLKGIIESATKQQHGTMVVFTENAEEEVKRLGTSGILITPTLVSEELVEAATSIDGALVCDEKGMCYAIGIILDGAAITAADSSRGARYNSALRYIEKRKGQKKKTFIVVVSEDKYVNCISTCKRKNK